MSPRILKLTFPKTFALAFAGALALAGCFGSPNESEKEDLPTITTQPSDKSAKIGDSAVFHVEATGAMTYQWVRNETDTLEGDTSNTLVLRDLMLSDNGSSFKCVVGNSAGTLATESANLTVWDPNPSRQVLIDTGEVLFSLNCAGCHGSEGEGSRGPQVANSDYVMGSKQRLIKTVLAGNNDSLQVNGVWYPGGGMPPWSNLSDVEVAGILTYLRAVLNDSLVTNCVPVDEFSANCDKTARTPQDIAADSVAAPLVTHVRDSLEIPQPAKVAAGVR